jgi:uncharacterized protein
VLTYAFQRSMQYHPNDKVIEPDALGLSDVNRVTLDTPDGEKIMAWYRKASAGRPTIVYFHGNAGGLSNRSEKIRYFISRDFGFLGVSYRGFEGSTGSPSEAGFMADANTAYDWLVAQGVAADRIMLLGESLGTGVAVQLAASKPVRALALEAPYANAVDVAGAAYWYFPTSLLMKDQFRSADYIRQVTAPLLIIHGTSDQLIPLAQGEKLFQKANEPKRMIPLDNKGHEMIFEPATWQLETGFFEEMLKAK